MQISLCRPFPFVELYGLQAATVTQPMGDTLKKVRAGDPLRIPTAAYNLFVDAARDFQRRAHGLGQGSMPSFRQATVVPGHRVTGDTVPISKNVCIRRFPFGQAHGRGRVA